jgi:uncharacterized membrane protein YbaN (DUF454 family)
MFLSVRGLLGLAVGVVGVLLPILAHPQVGVE